MSHLRPRRHRYQVEIEPAKDLRLAFEKPRKEDRKRANFDTTTMPHQKAHFDRNAEFKAFVRGLACLLSGWRNEECGGVTEFAHITTGGLQRKGSDLHGVNLCGNHHRLGPGSFHHLGSVEAFDAVHGTNLWQSNAELLAEWVRRMR